jgi:hypothetical protein
VALTPDQSNNLNVLPNRSSGRTSEARVSSSSPAIQAGLPGANRIVEPQSWPSRTICSVAPGATVICREMVTGKLLE